VAGLMRSPRRISDINIDYKPVGSAQKINSAPTPVECAYIRVSRDNFLQSNTKNQKEKRKKKKQRDKRTQNKNPCSTSSADVRIIMPRQ